jgi:hypothetical protein
MFSDTWRNISGGLPGDQPKPPNFPLSGEIVGRPNEFRTNGSIGEGDRSLGIAFIGETVELEGVMVELDGFLT